MTFGFIKFARRPILRIALPAIVSNITVPLLGLVDTAIVGHLGTTYMAAIALGGMLFNMVYWLFGFLRMGTGGMTAQAYGARRDDEVRRILLRALAVGTAIGVAFILLSPLILHLVYAWVNPSPAVAALTRCYVHILIWGAPAVMMLYALAGWFLGMQNARYPMVVAIVQNVANILVSLLLVVGLHRHVDGVATGTLVAQYIGLAMALWLLRRRYAPLGLRQYVQSALTTWRHDRQYPSQQPSSATASTWTAFFRINFDIFLRTLCLVAVTTWFTAIGTSMGDVILAANALLMQFFIIFSYFMDGLAYAGEALGGRYVGACRRKAFQHLVRRLFLWGTLLALCFTVVYAAGGRTAIYLLTDDAAARATALRFLPFAIAIPLAGFAAFIFDGLFIGATATRQMLYSMATAAATFFTLLWLLPPTNNSLWCAFLAYLFCRGVMQAALYRGMTRRTFVHDVCNASARVR